MNGRQGLTVAITEGEQALVTVSGELDLLAAAKLARPLRELIVERRPAIIDLDLSAVQFMDSTGIQVLVSALADARAAGIPLRVSDASPPVRRVLGMTGLLEALGLPAD
jgi:anti-anti-sigma factor